MWNIFRRWSNNYRWYRLSEKPDYISAPIKGRGQNILMHKGSEYLIFYTEQCEPMLIGKVQGRIMGPRETFRDYKIKVLFYHNLPVREREEINTLLSAHWSNDNLKDILATT